MGKRSAARRPTQGRSFAQAIALHRQGRLGEAGRIYDAIIAAEPRHSDALHRSGALKHQQGRSVEALRLVAAALRAKPDAAETIMTHGVILDALKRHEEALASFQRALELKPDNADAHFNEALTLLCLGDFRRGWQKYEWRWQCQEYAKSRPHYPRPQWRGDADVRGKTILLLTEQGLGDAIQFVRYAPMVAALGATVWLGVHASQVSLMQSVAGVARVFAAGDTLPEFDLYCPLLSLPLAFGTELHSIPDTMPYIRAADERIVHWRPRVPHTGRLRIGLCWAGAGIHPNDRRRSIPLESLADILAVPEIDFISLQKDASAADAAILHRHGVAELGRDFGDFADTAAVVSMLDLVISVDTSVAHLSGAMAKPTSVLLPFSPDFRWMLDRADSPWYPTMRLYRQSVIGDWSGPLARLGQDLAALVQRRWAKT